MIASKLLNCAMQFLYPQFLYALFLAAIPVLIHLFNFRRYKRIVFSDLRFLKHIIEENKKQQQIKKWLILLSRMLAIAFLVLAFAQPYIPKAEQALPAGEAHVSIYIDNSFSMQSIGKKGSLFDEAKNSARQLLEAYRPSDLFQLLSNDFEGKHQRWVNRKVFLQMLDELSISASHRNLDEIYARQKSLFQSGGDKGQLYWLSDFQKNMCLNTLQTDSGLNLKLIPFEGIEQQNIYIDTAWFPDPILKIGNQNMLKVIVKNSSEQPFENQPLVLKMDGQQKMIRNMSCKPGERAEVEFPFALPDNNWHAMNLSITDYPMVFDDVWHMAVKAGFGINVLLIEDNAKNKDWERIYKLDSFYRVKEMDIHQLNFADFGRYSLIILNEAQSISSGLADELGKYLDGGGVVFLIPASHPTNELSIKNFLQNHSLGLGAFQNFKTEVKDLEASDPIFKKVFSKIPQMPNMPQVQQYWAINGLGASYRAIMKLANDFPYLVRTKSGKGELYMLAGSLQAEAGNFAKHALFVPFMLNLPLRKEIKNQASFTLGNQAGFTFESEQSEKVLSLEKGKQKFLTEVIVRDGIGRARAIENMQEAGVYQLMESDKKLADIAFNFSRKESETKIADLDELATAWNATVHAGDISVLKASLEKDAKGSEYWFWALILVLLFLLIETALIRLWK